MDGTKILVNTINDSLGKGFTSYLKDNNISAYGEPVFIKDGNNFAYDYNNLTDYNATFAIVKELDYDNTNWDFVNDLKTYSLILTEEKKRLNWIVH
jgi:L-rhamnose mutarotase